MSLNIVYGDITKIKCDAVVNAANSSLMGGGGVDGAIHKAAGIGLFFECFKLGGCKVGEAKITKGYKLPCKYIIHTVGPKWRNGDKNKAILLHNCYINSLNLAVSNGCDSVAFPLISSGIYGCPKEIAMNIAVEAINSFLAVYDLQVYMVLYEK